MNELEKSERLKKVLEELYKRDYNKEVPESIDEYNEYMQNNDPDMKREPASINPDYSEYMKKLGVGENNKEDIVDDLESVDKKDLKMKALMDVMNKLRK